jgi:hypothetical protein
MTAGSNKLERAHHTSYATIHGVERARVVVVVCVLGGGGGGRGHRATTLGHVPSTTPTPGCLAAAGTHGGDGVAANQTRGGPRGSGSPTPTCATRGPQAPSSAENGRCSDAARSMPPTEQKDTAGDLRRWQRRRPVGMVVVVVVAVGGGGGCGGWGGKAAAEHTTWTHAGRA